MRIISGNKEKRTYVHPFLLFFFIFPVLLYTNLLCYVMLMLFVIKFLLIWCIYVINNHSSFFFLFRRKGYYSDIYRTRSVESKQVKKCFLNNVWLETNTDLWFMPWKRTDNTASNHIVYYLHDFQLIFLTIALFSSGFVISSGKSQIYFTINQIIVHCLTMMSTFDSLIKHNILF